MGLEDLAGASLLAAVVDTEDDEGSSLSDEGDWVLVPDNADFAPDSVAVSSSAGSSPIGVLAFDVSKPFADASAWVSGLEGVVLVTVLEPGVPSGFATLAPVGRRPLGGLVSIEYVLRSDFVGAE